MKARDVMVSHVITVGPELTWSSTVVSLTVGRQHLSDRMS